MHRLLRLSLFVVMFAAFAVSEVAALKPEAPVSGRVAPEEVRIFVKDSIYKIEGDYVIGGTLIIEPGTEIYFYPESRMIDSVGGRILADGFAKARYNANPDYQWGATPDTVSIDPTYPAGAYPNGKKNPLGWTGYADFDYVLYGQNMAADDAAMKAWHPTAAAIDQTIIIETERENTVHPDKYNHIFNVKIDNTVKDGRNKRDLVNLENPYEVMGADEYVVPYEIALMIRAGRLESQPDDDISLNTKPWKRINDKSVAIGDGATDLANSIKFIGQPVNNHSKEWGHIIVLPGARAAFFRNCSFEGFRKDTTVDRKAIYNEEDNPAWEWARTDRQKLNNRMRYLTNGSGGAITTFSSRTWLVNCSFKNNKARHKGGALQILQAPAGYPVDMDVDGSGQITRLYDIYDTRLWDESTDRYKLNKNPNVTGPDGELSTINVFWAARDNAGNLQRDMYGHLIEGKENVPGPNSNMVPVAVQRFPRIDNIDESAAFAEPTFNFADDASKADYYRQAYDDARLAVYLGRMRNLTFESNIVRLCNRRLINLNNPPVPVFADVLDEPADFPQEYGDLAYGGAIYIASDNNSSNGVDWLAQDPMGKSWLANRNQKMEVAFGINDKIWIDNSTTSLTFTHDEFVCEDNEAYNYSNQSGESNTSLGAKGGAIYCGNNTSLILAGQFRDNGAYAEFLVNDDTNPNTSYKFAMGGAVFASQTEGRLQLRGGPDRQENGVNNPTEFKDNVAAAGGAIAVDENISLKDNYLSPVIGGSDAIVPARDYGYNIKFINNTAICFGGAVFTKRNLSINGAGGVEVNTLIGYGGKYPVLFEDNYAGFAGGAVDVRLTSNADLEIGDRK